MAAVDVDTVSVVASGHIHRYSLNEETLRDRRSEAQRAGLLYSISLSVRDVGLLGVGSRI